MDKTTTSHDPELAAITESITKYFGSKLLQQDTAGAMVSARKLITESLSYFELCCSVHYLKLGKQGYYAPEYMPDFENF